MADLAKTVSIIFTGEDKLSVVTDGIEKRFVAIGSEAATASKKVDDLGEDLEGVGKKTAGIDAATTALKTLAASLVFKAFLDANIELEKFTRGMTVVTGSSAGAAEALEYVRGVADKLGIEFLGAADSFLRFSASTKGTALEGQAARDIFEAFAGTMSRLGVSSADINGAFVQLAQGIGKNRFELEDLKTIADRMPGFFFKFAESLGVTTDDLYKLISAGRIGNVEIKAFADALNTSLDGATFDGYEASFNRLKNSITDAFISIGETGAFDALTKAVELGTAAVTGAVAVFKLLGEVIGATAGYLTGNNPFSVLGDMTRDFINLFVDVGPSKAKPLGDAVKAAMDKAADATRGAHEALFDVNEKLDDTAKSGAQIGPVFEEGFTRTAVEIGRVGGQTKELDAALKTLGLDPKKFTADVDKILDAFKTLAADPNASGDTLLAGLKKTLSTLKNENQVNEVVEGLSERMGRGELTTRQYADMIGLARTKILDLTGALPGATKAAKEQEDQLKANEKAAEKAREAAERYKLEMEKLASNERIKLIEAKVALDIANVEANARTAIAAFESINATIDSTGDQLSSLFKLFEGDKLSFTASSDVRQQIELENKRRDEALSLQKRLIEAQINNIQAQTKALDKGDALIKIDGTNLQPHLEAFMFEVLRAIQTRVNAQGLDLLLGVPIV